MSRPFVSVITPSYNRREFLPFLLHQFNYDPDITNPDDVALHDEDCYKIEDIQDLVENSL